MKKSRYGAGIMLCAALLAAVALGCAGIPAASTPSSDSSPQQPSEFHTAKTTDGWTLALYRYRPLGPVGTKTPVILCHGLAMNGSLWDLKEDTSFARYLRGQGFDVWVVDLRGAGRSSKPGWVALHDFISRPEFGSPRYENTSLRFDQADWNIDDYVTDDIPAILQTVKKATGSPEVHWVGHSMGGMIMFAYLIRTQDSSVKTLVAMASPMGMPRPHTDLLDVLEHNSNLRHLAYFINVRVTARSFSFWSIFGTTPFDSSMYNRDNMDSDTVSRLLDSSVEDLSPGVAEGFLQFIKTGEYVSVDNSLNYTRLQTSIRLPLLLVGGWVDPMCSSVSLYDTYRMVASQDKTLKLFGRANGHRVDYGHNDLVTGRNAPQEVFPYISQWLKERS